MTPAETAAAASQARYVAALRQSVARLTDELRRRTCSVRDGLITIVTCETCDGQRWVSLDEQARCPHCGGLPLATDQVDVIAALDALRRVRA